MTSNRPDRERLSPVERRQRFLIGGAFASVFLIAGVIQPNTVVNGPVTCLLKWCTGMDCPFCGMTRAFVFAAHGNLTAANQFNPAWPIAAIIILTVVILCWRDARTGSNLAGQLWRWMIAHGWMLVTVLVLLTIARWAWPIQ